MSRLSPVGAVFLCAILGGCASLSGTGVGPPELVDQAQLELAIQAYVQATERLAGESGLTVTSGPPQVISANPLGAEQTFFQAKAQPASTKTLVVTDNQVVTGLPWSAADADDFIKTGAATAFILCQDYIAGLADRTDYLEYLRKQYGFAGTLANTAFVIWNASSTARSLLAAGNSFVNSSFDNYEQYKYFKPTDEAVLDVAKQAQTRLRDYYRQPANAPTNIAEALWAMHNIEHQCTHAGIKSLIDKTVQGATLEIDRGIVTVKK